MANNPSSQMTASVHSQVKIIQVVALAEIGVSTVILLCQTVAIAASYEFSTRSLTGIWTSWFFFMAAGLALFWSVRCTFNGLLAVLVLQIISATLAIPVFTACSILLGVYNFTWNPDEAGQAATGSSITILTTNLIMALASIAELGLNAYNAYNCYSLAYGNQPKENNYDQRSISSEDGAVTAGTGGGRESNYEEQETKSSEPAPPPDLTLASTDILIIKYCGVTGVILAVIIFCSQTTMLALANNDGIKIGVGIWGALYYFVTGIVTLVCGTQPSSQRTFVLFGLQLVQLILSIPMVCISLYVMASFGSCLQRSPFPDCTYKEKVGFGAADLAVTMMGGIISIAGMVQGLLSIVVLLICAQTVCGFGCMISGATVYPL